MLIYDTGNVKTNVFYNCYNTNLVHYWVLRLHFNPFRRHESCNPSMRDTTLEHLKDIAKRRVRAALFCKSNCMR